MAFGEAPGRARVESALQRVLEALLAKQLRRLLLRLHSGTVFPASLERMATKLTFADCRSLLSALAQVAGLPTVLRILRIP